MEKTLLKIAKEASNNSYNPYTNYCVGVALLTKSGKIYTGSNVENHGLQSICAERVAFAKAFSEGEPSNNKENYIAIMIVGHNRDSDELIETLPCGYCRQFISEFVNSKFRILTYDGEKIQEYTLDELLPRPFKI